MSNFWDIRYSDPDYAYGTKPNEYLRKCIDKLQPSSVLLPGEGEGRNAVYCAKLGWDVEAFDSSEQAKIKALKLAKDNNVDIKYHISSANGFMTQNKYGLLAFVFSHFGKVENNVIYPQLAVRVEKGGYIIFECFSVNQAKYHNLSGGPDDAKMLFEVEDIYRLFPDFDIIDLEEREIVLDEGKFHKGVGAVVNFFGKKK